MKFSRGVSLGLMGFNLVFGTLSNDIIPEEYKVIYVGLLVLVELIIYFLAIIIGKQLYGEN